MHAIFSTPNQAMHKKYFIIINSSISNTFYLALFYTLHQTAPKHLLVHILSNHPSVTRLAISSLSFFLYSLSVTVLVTL